jgi:hypothetical protein
MGQSPLEPCGDEVKAAVWVAVGYLRCWLKAQEANPWEEGEKNGLQTTEAPRELAVHRTFPKSEPQGFRRGSKYSLVGGGNEGAFSAAQQVLAAVGAPASFGTVASTRRAPEVKRSQSSQPPKGRIACVMRPTLRPSLPAGQPGTGRGSVHPFADS